MQSYDPNAADYECPRCYNRCYPCGCYPPPESVSLEIREALRKTVLMSKYVHRSKLRKERRQSRREFAKAERQAATI